MRGIQVTALDLAKRFIGIHERAGGEDHPFIQWCHSLCGEGYDVHDEVPWCSAFMQVPFYLLGLQRSGSAAARSWLKWGTSVAPGVAAPGFDIVILQRGDGPQPGPEVVDAPGHVGFFLGSDDTHVVLLGGNQGDGVTVASFPRARILGIRRML